MKWQPIETAPKDGRDVLLWDGEYDVAHFKNDFGDWKWITSEGVEISRATHWMPLPEPPDA